MKQRTQKQGHPTAVMLGREVLLTPAPNKKTASETKRDTQETQKRGTERERESEGERERERERKRERASQLWRNLSVGLQRKHFAAL